jgi:hypothetical protein
MSVIHVLPIININDKKRPNTLIKRSKTLRNGQERSRTVENGRERSGTVNGQGRWTVCNDHTVQSKRSETIAKSRSRYIHVHVSKTKETLYVIYSFHLPLFYASFNFHSFFLTQISRPFTIFKGDSSWRI